MSLRQVRLSTLADKLEAEAEKFEKKREKKEKKEEKEEIIIKKSSKKNI